MKVLSINNLISSDRDNPYPVLEISESALKNNFNLIKKITGNHVKTLVAVKANAYGIGLEQIMPFFKNSGPDYLGIANPYEGTLIRKYGWQGKILNLGGFYPEVAHLFFDYNISPSITDLWHIEHLEKMAKSYDKPLGIHIKLDFGMGRIGILDREISDLVGLLKTASMLKVKGIFTHFPSADHQDLPSNQKITEAFEKAAMNIIDDLEVEREDVILHAANSASLMLNPSSHFDMVRPGICFYGYFSDVAEKNRLSREFPFAPSLKLVAKPISFRTLKKGTSISYGETYKVYEDFENVGVVPLGYADGIPRQLSNKITFDGHPLLGRVTMDQIVLGKMSGGANETIELLGNNSPPLEYWADRSGTITYEVMTKLGDRIQRKLV